MPASTYLSSAQYTLSKTLYMQMLRDAFGISQVPRRPLSPRKKPKLASEGLLFRGSAALPPTEDSPEASTPDTDTTEGYDVRPCGR